MQGSVCIDIKNEITSDAKCKEAATSLNLLWGGTFDGSKDFPRCMYAQDARNKVFFNVNINPPRENINPKYSAICNINSGTVINCIIIR